MKNKYIFLLIWLGCGLLTFLPDNPNNLRYLNAMGTSVSVVILISYLISKLNSKIVLFLLVAIFASNLSLIIENNKKGAIKEVSSQTDLLLHQEKKAIDYIYLSAGGRDFSINAITVPYNINTTWGYLFEWYGNTKYGYLPVWTGVAADGFEGNLKVVTARSSGPKLHFLILEPQRGLVDGLVNKYIDEENIFTKVLEERNFGLIKVQKRVIMP